MSDIVKAIINGKAGGMAEQDVRQTLTDLLQAAFPGIEILFAEPTTDVTGWVRKAVADGATMVIGGGGDGTINSVAAGLAGTQVVLGVLPLGTLNHFAKDLGLPLEVEAAVQALKVGEIKAVDVGQVNDRFFLNNSGLGLYPTIVKIRESKQREGIAKWPAAIYATVKAMLRYRLLTLFVKVKDRDLERRTPIVFIGNNEYKMDGVGLPTRTGLNDGQLCLYIPHPTQRANLIWFSLKALLKGPRPGKDYDAFLAREFRIQSRHRHLSISVDGEVWEMNTPLNYQVRPGHLRVMAPAIEA